MKQLLLVAILLLQLNGIHAQPSDSYLQGKLDNEKIPGATMAIIKDGYWIYDRSFGKADIAKNKAVSRHKLFALSSASNAMITTAVMQLWEKGKLNIDNNISNYLPFQIINPFYPTDSITLKMLLTHTAAIKDNWATMNALTVTGDCPVALDSFARNYFKQGGIYYNATGNFYNEQPGTKWYLSNMSMVLAAYVIEHITGDAFSHYCDTAMLDKLCMKNSFYKLSDIQDTNIIARPYSWDGSKYSDVGLYGCPGYPAIMLRSNLADLSRFMKMYMQYGRYEGSRILDSTTVVYMMQQYTPSLFSQTQALLYQGIGFYTRVAGNGDVIWGQEGSMPGGSAAMYFNYTTKTGVIMLMNGIGINNPLMIMDTLYKYGITVTPDAKDTFPDCNESTFVTTVKEREQEIVLFPNPSAGDIHIHVQEQLNMVLTDMQGRVKKKGALQKGGNHVLLNDVLQQGIYFVHLYNEQGALVATRKLVHIQ